MADSHSCDSNDKRPQLLINTTWEVDAPNTEALRFGELMSCFPEIVLSQPERVLDQHPCSLCWSGVSRVRSTGSWWQRLIFRRPIYQWRFWLIRRGPVRVTAMLQSVPGRPVSESFLRTCQRVLESLEFAEHPAYPPELFRRNVIDLATKSFPLLTVSSSGSFSVRVEDSEINLTNLYRAYLRQPESFRQIVLPGITTVVRMRELGPEQLMPQLELVREQILPMLSAEPEDNRTPDDIVRVPWVGGLRVSYVLDEPESYRFIDHRMLRFWKLDEDRLHELAIANLRQFAVTNPLEVTVIGDDDDSRILMPIRPNAYNCARLLDESFHGRLRELFGPELVVGVPNRDFFVAVSMKDPSLIQRVALRVESDHANMDHPLTRRLLVISADGVSEYCGDVV